jgi:hypothetical protein
MEFAELGLGQACRGEGGALRLEYPPDGQEVLGMSGLLEVREESERAQQLRRIERRDVCAVALAGFQDAFSTGRRDPGPSSPRVSISLMPWITTSVCDRLSPAGCASLIRVSVGSRQSSED